MPLTRGTPNDDETRSSDLLGDARFVSCVHGTECGGCTRLDTPYGAQREAKRARVVAAFERYAELARVVIDETVAAEPLTQYRTRAKLVAGSKGALGLYARTGDHVTVDLPHCRVLAPVVARAVAAIRVLMAQGALRSEADGGALTALDVREVLGADAASEPRAMVTLVLRAGKQPSHDAMGILADRLIALEPSIASVASSVVRSSSRQLLGTALRVHAGDAALPDRIGAGGTYQLAAHGSFVQAHRGQAAELHAAVHEALFDALGSLAERRIVDLYAGSGALGLALAERGARVLSVEAYPAAVEHALEAARAQRLNDVFGVAGDAADVAAELAQSGTRVDAAIVNPPRRGCAPEVRFALAALAPEVIAYISCDPETLARDLAHLARLGYATQSARPYDMIPLTDEVETLAILHRAPLPPPRVLYEDDTLLAVEKAGHEPTTPQGEYASSLLMRVRRLPGGRSAVPIHRLDAGTSGVCLFARRPEDVTPWQMALGAAEAEKRYVALVRGVIRAKGTISRALPDEGVLREARTRYRRTAVLAGHALIEARPDEGRMHQVRRHLATLGHAVVGDARYGHAPSNRHFSEKYGLDRTFLHCASITLLHPETHELLVLEAPLAPDLDAVLARLRDAPAHQ